MRYSIIVFISINLVVLAMPYFTARPFNNRIRAGLYGDRDKEDSLKKIYLPLKAFQNLKLNKEHRGLTVEVILSEKNYIEMDSSLRSFITIRQSDDSLVLFCDDVKFKQWQRSQVAKVQQQQAGVSYDAATAEVVAVEPYPDTYGEGGAYDVGFTIKIYTPKLISIQSAQVNVQLKMTDSFHITTPFNVVADSADIDIDYTDVYRDSLGSDGYNTLHLKEPLQVVLKNQASVDWSYMVAENLSLYLYRSYWDWSKHAEEVYFHPSVWMDNFSDMQINYSSLKELKIYKQ